MTDLANPAANTNSEVFRDPRVRLVVIILSVIVLFLLALPTWRGLKLWRAHMLCGEAEALIANEDYEKVIEKLQAAYNLSPGLPRARRNLARFFAQHGSEQALFFWRSLLNDGKATEEDQREMASFAIAIGQRDLAETLVNRLYQENPSKPSNLMLMAQLSLRNGDNKTAERCLRQAIQISPNFAEAYFLLSRVLSLSKDEKDHLEARQILMDLIQRNDRIALDAIRLLAQDLNLPQSDAERLISRLRSHPLSKTKEKLLAYTIEIRYRPDEHDALIQKAIQQYSKTPEELVELGRWLNQTRNFERVLQVISPEAALRRQDYFLIRMDALASLKRWEEVLRILQKERCPLPTYILHLYTYRALKELNQPEDAQLAWTRALSAANGAQPLMYLAQYAERIGAIHNAIAAYERLTGHTMAARIAYLALVRLRQQLPDTEALRHVYERMVKLTPQDPVIRNDLAYLNLLLKEKIQESFQVAQHLVETLPHMLAFRITLALAYLRQQDPEKALGPLDNLPVDWKTLQPSWRAIYAAVLAANKRIAEAEDLLTGVSASQIRNEEIALLKEYNLTPRGESATQKVKPRES
ncbi:MAG: tetratricopeptide repeat protein [Methylacidiphilales bacterium]|nr:tetratricopeptide repeat protein [Candidatus Methylacidiphilales bacterium]MDW8349302.1 tetratricopeptide repeat protein [Verrucomicrobiae bacterium]